MISLEYIIGLRRRYITQEMVPTRGHEYKNDLYDLDKIYSRARFSNGRMIYEAEISRATYTRKERKLLVQRNSRKAQTNKLKLVRRN